MILPRPLRPLQLMEWWTGMGCLPGRPSVWTRHSETVEQGRSGGSIGTPKGVQGGKDRQGGESKATRGREANGRRLRRGRVQGKDQGNWREANGRGQLQSNPQVPCQPPSPPRHTQQWAGHGSPRHSITKMASIGLKCAAGSFKGTKAPNAVPCGRALQGGGGVWDASPCGPEWRGLPPPTPLSAPTAPMHLRSAS